MNSKTEKVNVKVINFSSGIYNLIHTLHLKEYGKYSIIFNCNIDYNAYLVMMSKNYLLSHSLTNKGDVEIKASLDCFKEEDMDVNIYIKSDSKEIEVKECYFTYSKI